MTRQAILTIEIYRADGGATITEARRDLVDAVRIRDGWHVRARSAGWPLMRWCGVNVIAPRSVEPPFVLFVGVREVTS